MPVQQAIDIGIPVTAAYNHFTQFEEWPKFMHRVQSVSQDDETHLKFKTKIWLFSREFTAEIEEQRPDERIQWNVTEGITHHGVATFHEIAPRLTRVEINVDVEPSGLIEKSARGMRHVKRAIRADLHRFKAYVMMNEEPEGEWRGTIEDGEVKQQRESQSSRGGSRRSDTDSSSSGSSRSGTNRGSGSSRSSGSKSRSGSRSKAASSSERHPPHRLQELAGPEKLEPVQELVQRLRRRRPVRLEVEVELEPPQERVPVVMGPLKDAVLARLGGDKPSPLRAAVAAAIAGIIVAVLTYKLLRS